MANLGQHLRQVISSKLFGREENRNGESFSGPSEMLANIITSSKISISALQVELESSLSSLNQLSEKLSSESDNDQPWSLSSHIDSTTEILFHTASLTTNSQSQSPELDLSEISITPISPDSKPGNHELEQILITPL